MIAAWFACLLLKMPLSLRARTKLIGAILERVEAVPLRDIITRAEDGSLRIEGRPVEYDQAVSLRESAIAMLNNQARRYVQAQVLSVAGHRGVVEGDTPEKLYFYRAAIWWALTEEEIYKQLAGE